MLRLWAERRCHAQATWIVFLDGLGRPAVFFPRRDSDGGVIGDGINLQQKGI